MRIDGVPQVRRWNGAIASLLLSIVAGAAGASTVTYQYDASGRLTSVSRNDGMTITYTLDAAGNRQSVTMVAGSGVSGRNEYRVPEAVHYVVVHVERPLPPGEKATLKYSTVAGTALPGRDFDAVSGILRWAPEDTSPKEVAISIRDEQIFERQESFQLRLKSSDESAAGMFPRSATITIEDNDRAPSFRISKSRVLAGAKVRAYVVVEKLGKTTLEHKVELSLSEPGALSFDPAITRTLTFTPTEKRKRLILDLPATENPAGNLEQSEGFLVTLRRPTNGALLSASQSASRLAWKPRPSAKIAMIQQQEGR